MEPLRFVEKSRFDSSFPSIGRFSFMDFFFGRSADFHFAEHFRSHHGILKILFFIWIFLATWLIFPAFHFGGAGTIVFYSSNLVVGAPSFSCSDRILPIVVRDTHIRAEVKRGLPPARPDLAQSTILLASTT